MRCNIDRDILCILYIVINSFAVLIAFVYWDFVQKSFYKFSKACSIKFSFVNKL